MSLLDHLAVAREYIEKLEAVRRVLEERIEQRDREISRLRKAVDSHEKPVDSSTVYPDETASEKDTD